MQGYIYGKDMIPCVLNPTTAETLWGMRSGIEDCGGCKLQVGASFTPEPFYNITTAEDWWFEIWSIVRNQAPPCLQQVSELDRAYLKNQYVTCRQSSKDLGTHFDFASGHDLITLRHMARYSQSLKATRSPDHVEISGGQEGHIGIICKHPCWATWSCLSQINGLTVGPVAGFVVIFGSGNGLLLDIYLTTFDILWPCFSLSCPFMVIQMLFGDVYLEIWQPITWCKWPMTGW